MRLILIFIGLTAVLISPAIAHPGSASAASFSAGVAHPFSGLDHIAVMVAVGLWAALKGDRALWVWPMTFIGVMLFGALLGMAHVALPFVDAGILVSVVALGLAVTFAIDLPIVVGAGIIGIFAFLHGHAHGTEVAETINGLEYMAGFVVATATLPALGISLALDAHSGTARPAIRLVGGTCIAIGVGLFSGVL
jgi:urease accessory protein